MSEPFVPSVESLLKYAADSPQFIDAAESPDRPRSPKPAGSLKRRSALSRRASGDVEGKLAHLAEEYRELRGGD
jgi:hypothetical protein